MKKPAEKPLPCPFCGKRPRVWKDDSAWREWLVSCISMRCVVHPNARSDFETRAAAVAAWNRRAK